jgi:DNA mismatch repair protein MutS2
MVEVVGRGIRGELEEVSGGRARIQRGGLRFELPADQLRVVHEAAPRERVALSVERPEQAADEINLIGRRAREAVEALAAFLDRAARAGLAEVRVVHGLGSGALRRAVHEFLDATPYCSTYRDAEQAAGGAGVTIAEIA